MRTLQIELVRPRLNRLDREVSIDYNKLPVLQLFKPVFCSSNSTHLRELPSRPNYVGGLHTI